MSIEQTPNEVKLAAGTNNIGDVDVLTLPALVAGTANIGDVDVLSVPAPLSTTGGGAEATALRVTIANDSTGVVSVDDNGGSLTVDAPVATPVAARLSDGAAFYDATKTGQLPTVLVGGRLDENLGAWLGSTAPSIGQKTMANSLPMVIASDQTVIPVNGDIDHDVANTLKNIQIAGNASPVDVPPTAVSANGDRVRAWMDRSGALIVRRRKLRESYTAVFRLGEAAARLDQTFTHTANTNKQWATLHHTAGATKEVRLLSCIVWVTAATTVAPQGIIELRQLTAATAPATGNPAITPTPHRRGGTAAEAVALYLPTTAGTEANVNSPLGMHIFDDAVSVATAAFQHPQNYTRGGITLYDASLEDDEMMPPVLPVATLDGWAVVARFVGATVARITVVMKFTEEIP